MQGQWMKHKQMMADPAEGVQGLNTIDLEAKSLKIAMVLNISHWKQICHTSKPSEGLLDNLASLGKH